MKLTGWTKIVALAGGVLGAALVSLGAAGDGCSVGSRSPAPDVTGWWDISYDDTLAVKVTLGGSVYERTIGLQGGTITIEHGGESIDFALDCGRPEVICPSEAWPAAVKLEQRETDFEHKFIATLPVQRCDGALVTPAAADCGAGTHNPDCAKVCDGTIVVEDQERLGSIGDDGTTFRIWLGAGAASNGVNCLMVGASVADAAIVSAGSSARGNWEAVALEAGQVTVGYAGGCLWAGDPDADGELEALVLGASIKISTGFTGTKG